jgi:DNA polymerase III delta prime subunit
MWCDKYSPKHIDDLITDEYIKKKLRNFVKCNEMSNLILSGTACSGKTTILKCLANDFYGRDIDSYVYRINSSVEKSVKLLQEMLESFCRQKVVTTPPKKKMFIIDDIDEIPDKLQSVIAIIMETFPNVYFTFTCTSTSLINELIQSRCILLYVQKIEYDNVISYLKRICEYEKKKYDINALKKLYEVTQEDFRISINTMQILCNNYDEITINNLNKICDAPNPIIIQKLLSHCISHECEKAFKIGIDLFNEGYNCSDVLNIMIDILKSPLCFFDENDKIEMLKIIGKTLYNVCRKNDSSIQLEKCIIKLCNFTR